MIRTLSVLALVAAASTLAACAAESKPSATPTPAPAPAAGGAPVSLAPVKMEPSANYPLDTCVVTGEKLGSMGDRIAYKVGDTEVQLCCKMCVGKLTADPAKYVAMVQAAAKK